MRLLILCCLPLALTQCVDPYGNPISPFGPPMAPPPYPSGREEYRSDMREYDRNQSQQAYTRGWKDGADDGRSGLRRGSSNPYGYNSAQAQAYQDGYTQGYQSNSSAAPGYGQNRPTPAYPDDSPSTPSTQAPSNDPSYNQGYEYGLRDRVAGRQADAGAHVGSYDPRFRRSFERGYYDAFESRR